MDAFFLIRKPEIIASNMLNEESLSQKFIRRGFWLYVFTFLAAPLGYIIKMTLSRDLSIDELGLFYGIISLITLLSAFNDLGATEALNYFLPKHIIAREYGKVKYLLRLVFKLQMISSLLIIAVLLFFKEVLAISHFKNPIA